MYQNKLLDAYKKAQSYVQEQKSLTDLDYQAFQWFVPDWL